MFAAIIVTIVCTLANEIIGLQGSVFSLSDFENLLSGVSVNSTVAAASAEIPYEVPDEFWTVQHDVLTLSVPSSSLYQETFQIRHADVKDMIKMRLWLREPCEPGVNKTDLHVSDVDLDHFDISQVPLGCLEEVTCLFVYELQGTDCLSKVSHIDLIKTLLSVEFWGQSLYDEEEIIVTKS